MRPEYHRQQQAVLSYVWLACSFAVILGCAPHLSQEPSTLGSLVTLPAVATLTPSQKNSIDSLGVSVDSLSTRFLRLRSAPHIPSAVKKRWLFLTRRAEELRKAVPANEKLLFLLGDLYRIGIFLGIRDAALSAEYYLTRCIELHPKDYRPYMLLAWLYIRKGCVFPEKTRFLLSAVDRKLADTYYPYVQMLWGYYYYICKDDPEKAFGCFISYLAFDPDDLSARRTYLLIKRELLKKNGY
jgi:hypothetical protein